MLTQISLPSLVKGDRGMAVALLQRLLIIYGYEQLLKPGDVDGIFGEGTSQAVKAFQGDHYLLKDGQVGALTWKAMAYPFSNPNL
jgi:peptidoglycan hydrolase-like protein with peptidoglycan-binding domain